MLKSRLKYALLNTDYSEFEDVLIHTSIQGEITEVCPLKKIKSLHITEEHMLVTTNDETTIYLQPSGPEVR